MISSATVRAALRTAFPDQPDKPRDAVIAAACGAAVLVASFVNFLNHNDYPIMLPEVALVALLLIAAAGFAGLLYRFGGPGGRIGLVALLALLAFDFNFDGTVVLLLALATVLLVRGYAVPFLGIVSAVVLATEAIPVATHSPVQASEIPTADEHAQLPALLHIVLDEHIGVEGLLGDDERTTALRTQLKSFYVRNGFRLFGGAYSGYYHTRNSMPHLLNFSAEAAPEERPGDQIVKNAYFDRLDALGYRIEVLQTDFVDFCGHAAVDACRTVTFTGFDAAAESDLDLAGKADLIASSFLSTSGFVVDAASRYDSAAQAFAWVGVDLPAAHLSQHRRASAIGGLYRLDDLAKHMRDARPGTAYFAHVIAPHDPYSVAPDCALRPDAWLTRHSDAEPEAVRNAYYDQVSCVMTKVGRIIESLDAAVGPGNSFVIVHGDHGARIRLPDPSVESVDMLRDEDIVWGFSTLFAVRGPAIAAGYEGRRAPVGSLLDAATQPGSASLAFPVDAKRKHFVTLADEQARPSIRMPLPEWWASGQ